MKFRANRDQGNPVHKRNLTMARKDKYAANQCENFFKNQSSHLRPERVKKTFKFLSKFKRNSTQVKNMTFIPISQWLKLLPSLPRQTS